MPNFWALGAPPQDPRASGGWGLCPQTPWPPLASGGWGLRPQILQTAPFPIANFWLRAWIQSTDIKWLTEKKDQQEAPVQNLETSTYFP